MSTLGALVMAAGLLGWVDEPKSDVAKADMKALQGAWSMSSVVVNGEEVPADVLKEGKLVVEGDKYTATLNVSITSTFTLDPQKKPKAIDFKYTDGPQQGQSIKGIYEVEDDTFRLCRGLAPEAERPTKFESGADSGLIFVVYKRSKPAAGDKNAADKQAAVRAELEKFQGVWQMIAAETDGKPAAEDFIKKTRVTITGNTHSVRVGDQVIVHDITFEVDPSTTPKQVTDTINGGDQKGKQIRGIYRIEGDQLTSCVARMDEDRPTEFVTKPGSGHTMRVFKRVKEDGSAK